MSAPHLRAGREIRLNLTTVSNQDHAAVTVLADGSYVAVWDSAGQDGSGAGVFGRHFATDGTAISGEFRIAEADAGNQTRAQIAALDDGGFAVVWQAGGTNPDDGGAAEPWDIYLRLFDADGTARGHELRANMTDAGTQSWADIVTRTDGTLAVTWRDRYLHTTGLTSVTADGVLQGPEVVLGSPYIHSQCVAALADGSQVVIWSGSWDPGAGLYGQIIGSDGNYVSETIHINDDFPNGMSGDQVYPAAVALPGGGFVVTWLTAGDGWPPGIRGRIFDAAGAAVTGIFGVSDPVACGTSDIAVLADGSFVVVWAQSGTDGGDILARRFLADGTALGGARLVTAGVASDQQAPHVAATPDGGYVVTWQSLGSDGDGWGVYSRVFPAETYGTNGDDRLEDRPGTGWINGLGGDDTILGLTGDDTLSGGGGNDSVAGGLGQDAIWLGGGNDTGLGGDGADSLLSQDGSDLLAGGAGDDTLSGGRGGDSLTGEDGADRLDGGEGADVLDGGLGNDSLAGRAGADTVLGQAGDDTINGFEGDDELRGGTGNDVIWGGAGNDTLSGSAGSDTLRGGDGADVMIFDATAGHDVAALFEPGIDEIRLSAALWGGGLTVDEVVASFARAVAGGVLLEFAGGTSTIELQGANLAGLADDIVLF